MVTFTSPFSIREVNHPALGLCWPLRNTYIDGLRVSVEESGNSKMLYPFFTVNIHRSPTLCFRRSSFIWTNVTEPQTLGVKRLWIKYYHQRPWTPSEHSRYRSTVFPGFLGRQEVRRCVLGLHFNLLISLTSCSEFVSGQSRFEPCVTRGYLNLRSRPWAQYPIQHMRPLPLFSIFPIHTHGPGRRRPRDHRITLATIRTNPHAMRDSF